MDEFSVDKLFVADGLSIIYHNFFGVVPAQPFLAFLCIFLAEDKFKRLVVFGAVVPESDTIALQLLEVLLCLFVSACSQSFVVLYPPTLEVWNRLCPSLEVAHRVERYHFSAFGNFEQGSDELLEKTLFAKQARPVSMDEVDN